MDIDKKYIVTTEAKEITGVVQSWKVKEAPGPNEDQGKDKVVELEMLKLDAPVDFTCENGFKIQAFNIHIIEGKAGANRYIDKRVRIKGNFYQGHGVKHHSEVIVVPESIELAAGR